MINQLCPKFIQENVLPPIFNLNSHIRINIIALLFFHFNKQKNHPVYLLAFLSVLFKSFTAIQASRYLW